MFDIIINKNGNFPLIIQKLNQIMATQAEFLQKLGLINTGLDNIQADLDRLKEQVGNAGLPAEVEDELLASIDGILNRVTTIADSTPEPEPEPPVEG